MCFGAWMNCKITFQDMKAIVFKRFHAIAYFKVLQALGYDSPLIRALIQAHRSYYSEVF